MHGRGSSLLSRSPTQPTPSRVMASPRLLAYFLHQTFVLLRVWHHSCLQGVAFRHAFGSVAPSVQATPACGLAQRRRNQAATSASTGRSPLVVSASHDSDSTPARPSSVFPLWPWKIGWCRRASKCAGSDAASAEKAPSFQQIVSAVYQQRHLAKNKRAKKDDQALRTSVHIQIGKHLDCRPDRLVHDDTGTSAETSCHPP